MSTFRWLAFGPSGEAHAVPARGRVTRTACGQPVADNERMTWPTRTRCVKCSIALGFAVP